MKNVNDRRLFWIGIFLPIILWELIVQLTIISRVFFASPSEIIIAFYKDLINSTLLNHSVFTLLRALIGFVLGSFLGVVSGLLLGKFKSIYTFFSAYIEFFRSIPVLSLFPLFLLFFGIGDFSKIMIASWSSFFIVIIPTIYGVTHIPQIKITAAKLLGANKKQEFFHVILPAALPEILAGLRIGLSISLIAVVVTEMFTGTKIGIGKYIYDAGLIYETDKLYAGIAFAGLLGLITNKSFIYLENKYVHWKNKL